MYAPKTVTMRTHARITTRSLGVASTLLLIRGAWPMWGGTPDRNMVSNMKGLPAEWDLKTKKNVKWIAELGSQSYGNAVVAGGMVLVGTNNEAPRDPQIGRAA